MKIAIVMCALVAALSQEPSGPPSTATVAQIHQLCKERVDSIKNAKVRYATSYKVIEQPPAFQKENIQLLSEGFELSYVFDKERRRVERNPEPPEGVPASQRRADQRPLTAVFDGRRSLLYRGGGFIELHDGKMEEVDKWDVFSPSVLGILTRDSDRVNRRNAWLFPDVLENAPEARAQYVVRPRQESVDGHPCHVVEAKGYDQIWVDLGLKGVIRKRLRYADPSKPDPLTKYHFQDFKQERNTGMWLPMKLDVTEYMGPPNPQSHWGRPFLETTIQVKSISLNDVTDEDFKVYLAPGQYVMDAKSGNAYQVPVERVDLVQDLVNAGDKYLIPGGGGQAGNRVNRRWWIIGINAALIVGIAGYFVYRQINKPTSNGLSS